jgi:hypothetical protein
MLSIIKNRQRRTYSYHNLSRFEEAKRIWKRVAPPHSSVCLATKPVLGVIAHITIFRIAALLNVTQIVAIAKFRLGAFKSVNYDIIALFSNY